MKEPEDITIAKPQDLESCSAPLSLERLSRAHAKLEKDLQEARIKVKKLQQKAQEESAERDVLLQKLGYDPF